MTLADRIVVLRDGLIEQVGTPLELYDKPANQFVAQFIGSPQMNVLPVAQVPGLRTLVQSVPEGGFVGLRPESLNVGPAGQGHLQGRIELVEALGAETLIYVSADGGVQLVARQDTRTPLRAGDAVGISVDAANAHVFDAQGRVLRAAQRAAAG